MKRGIIGGFLVTLLLCGCANKTDINVNTDDIDTKEAYELYTQGMEKINGLDSVCEKSEFIVHMQTEDIESPNAAAVAMDKTIEAEILRMGNKDELKAQLKVISTDGDSSMEENSFYTDGFAYFIENNTKKQIEFEDRRNEVGAYEIKFAEEYVQGASAFENGEGKSVSIELDTENFNNIVQEDMPFFEDMLDLHDESTNINYAYVEFELDSENNIKDSTFNFEAVFDNGEDKILFDIIIGRNYSEFNAINVELPSDLATFEEMGEWFSEIDNWLSNWAFSQRI